MTMHLPDWVDEQVDPCDPLSILLAREGSNDEAYVTAQNYRAGQQQLVVHAEIEGGVDESEVTDHEWTRRTRRLSGKPTITRN